MVRIKPTTFGDDLATPGMFTPDPNQPTDIATPPPAAAPSTTVPTEPKLPTAPSTTELAKMREEAEAIPVPQMPEKEANMASAVSQAQRVTGFDTSLPEQPESQARVKADKLLQRLDEFQRTDFSTEMESAVDKLREDRQQAEQQVQDKQQREQMIHAIGKMAAGLIGLASLQDKQSRGIDLGGLEFEKSDFNAEYDRLFRNYMADTEAVKERIRGRERQERGELETLGTAAGIAAREAEGEATREARAREGELDRQFKLTIANADRINKEEAQQLSLEMKRLQLAAMKAGKKPEQQTLQEASIASLHKLKTNAQFLDTAIKENSQSLDDIARAAGLPESEIQVLHDDIVGEGWFDIEETPATAIGLYLEAIRKYTRPIIVVKDNQEFELPGYQAGEAEENGYTIKRK